MIENIIVGDNVEHRHQKYPIGVVVKILEGCNTLYYVDFGTTSYKTQSNLTICCKDDIKKV